MRNLKRALSLALASVMLVGMMVVGASAASFPDVDESKHDIEAIEVLKAVGVMNGDAGTGKLRPDDKVSRNEMAVIMARLILGTYAADSYVGSHPFTDVPSWADRYVAACYSSGIIKGTSDTTYGGTNNVTAVQAAAMMLRALGYEDLSLGAARWDIPVAGKANEVNLFEGLAGSSNAQLTRNDIATLSLNALKTTMVTTVRDGQDITLSDGTKFYATRRYNERNSSASWATTIDSNTAPGSANYLVQLGEYLYRGDLELDIDEDDYGMPAAKWTYDGKEVITSTEAPDYTWTTGIEDITLGDLYKALGSKTGDLDIYENGVDSGTDITPTKGSSTKSLAAYKGATIYAVDTHENGKASTTDPDGIADRLCVVYPYLAKVTKVTDATSKAERKITMDVWNDNTGAKISGVTYETEDFAKDDFVLVFPGDKMATTEGWNASAMSGDIIDVKPVDVVSGKVTTVKKDSYSDMESLTIDGTKYTVGGPLMATKGNDDNTLVKDSTFGFRSEYTLYLSNGYIVGSEGVNGAKDIDNIVYVTHATPYTPVDEWGTAATKRVQVIRMDGTVEILKVETASEATLDAAGFYTIDDANNDDKYTFAKASASSAINNTTIYYGTNAVNGAVTMKADDKTININTVDGKTSAYLTSNTRILFVKDSKADLKTSMVTGPIRQNVANGSVVLLSKDSGNFEVEVLVVNAEKANASDDVVYVNNTPKGDQADGVKLYTIYDAKTGEKQDVPAKPGDVVNGFATYSVNDDGQYKFTSVTTASSKNADGSYAITHALTKYGNLISEGFLSDVDAADAVIINNTGDEDNDNLNLSDVASAKDLAGFVYVVDEKAIAIVVNDYSETGVRAIATADTAISSVTSVPATTSVAGVDVSTALTGKTEDNKMAAVKGALDADALGSSWTFTVEDDGSIKAVAQTAGAEGTSGPAALSGGFTQTKAGKEAVIAAKATASVTLAASESITAGGVTIAYDTLNGKGDVTDAAAGSDMTYSWNDTSKAVTLTAKTAGAAGNDLEYTGKDGSKAKLSGGKTAADAVAAEYTLAKSYVKLAASETLTFNGKTYTVTGADIPAKMQSWATQYNTEGHDTDWTASVDAAASKFVFTAKRTGAAPTPPTGTTVTTPGA